MLQSLHIKDFILIEKLDLDFNAGFCVITGDTGAGKSILLDSILFCLGGKFASDPIKPGVDSCTVTAIFSASKNAEKYLSDLGIEIDNEIIVKRTQNISGRKKILINDQIVTAKLAQGLFDHLLELHGQHNHTLLLNTSSHMQILDEFGGLYVLKDSVSDNYKIWQNLEDQIAEFNKAKTNIESEIDYLQHICAELDKADIQENEEQELADIKRKLQGRDKEISLISGVISDIEASSLEQLIAKSQRAISSLESDQSLEDASVCLELAYDKIEDAKSILENKLRDFDAGDYSLEEVEDRLYEIRSLARKHSCSPADLLEFFSKSSQQLQHLEGKIIGNSHLEEEARLAKELYFTKSVELSKQRKLCAKELEQKTMSELALLQMQKAKFKAEIITSNNNATAKGVDQIRFIASTNPGMKLSPIDKIASGGELSRFMLAFRVALFDNAPKQAIIFDEIDVGISGSVADSMGQRLKMLSNAVQIIVITHQPQVAGGADQHILVEKTQTESHTSVKVGSLDEKGKSYELARMISGQTITETGLQAAKELIKSI